LSKSLNEQEINEFADLFHQNLNEELELLHKEEEILTNLKHNLIHDLVGSAAESDSDSLNGISPKVNMTKTPTKNIKKLQIKHSDSDDKSFKKLMSARSGGATNRETNSIPFSASSNSCRSNQNQGKGSNKAIEVNKKNITKK
jgi:hypothetical protein